MSTETTTAARQPALDTPPRARTRCDLSGLKQPYHLVDPSPWPIVGALGGGLTLFGIVEWAHGITKVPFFVGLLADARDRCSCGGATCCARAGRRACIRAVVRLGLRYGMMLFIASEVMFFVGFFWAYFHFALYPDHVLGAATPAWPPAGVHTFNPFHLPLLNTLILLLSGTTITWAHHALIEGDRKHLIMGLGFTVLLGLSLHHLPGDRVFGRAVQVQRRRHLSVGVLPGHRLPRLPRDRRHRFLIVCWFRARGGDFTPQRHFGFEAAAWYWHFVDVVWLFLFVCIYLGGAGSRTSVCRAGLAPAAARRLASWPALTTAADAGASRHRRSACGRCERLRLEDWAAGRDRPRRGRAPVPLPADAGAVQQGRGDRAHARRSRARSTAPRCATPPPARRWARS